MMLSVGKIFQILIILVSVWYIFKIIKKRKLNFRDKNENKSDTNKKGIDAFKCDKCGLWSTGDHCKNKECSKV